MTKKSKASNHALTALFSVFSLVYIAPIAIIVYNSFKKKAYITRTPFDFPNEKTFAGLENYVEGITKTNFWDALATSFFVTAASVIVILLCTSMAAWYISRTKSRTSRIFYYLCVFSMVVPFQMVMFTLSKTADYLHLGNPLGLVFVYLGFGAGLAVFMFSGFMKSVPIEIEEAAMIDGCNPIQTFFLVVLPILRPTLISVGILETMWIWNDYLLPYLILDLNKWMTIPIAVQYLKGGYGSIDWGAMMAMLVLAIIPIIIFYISCQKHIIKGVAAGAVKG
ncbi:MAG: carbohydrate ABC transporter permease [Clostridiales bacterium]|jgi:raffinose/stachyose/melibiose transport system permease protein|nr:carbohydrate ABC transporter permease [Clostridiales bacterium]